MKTYLTTMKILVAVALSLVPFCSNAGQTSYYIYDESGHVIGEYDANGNPVQEHIYLGDRPVAVVQGGSSGTVDYVSTDQLNTPRVITDGSHAVLWSWNSDPFGNSPPIGSLSYDLRFPGQQYDNETGHNYNNNRDYDPGVGRYIQSDPVGLLGGINTFTYVRDNPISKFDFSGLCDTLFQSPNNSFNTAPTVDTKNGIGKNCKATRNNLTNFGVLTASTPCDCKTHTQQCTYSTVLVRREDFAYVNCDHPVFPTYDSQWIQGANTTTTLSTITQTQSCRN